MTETEQLNYAMTRQLTCQAILATTGQQCHRPAVSRIRIQCITPGCYDERMFLCATCTGYVAATAAACLTCGQLPVITGTA